VAALAQEAGISRRWATECFKRLTGSGYIVPIDGTGGGRSITVTYRMGELNTVSSCRPQTVNPSSQFSAQNCEVQFLKVRTVVPQSMKWGSHDPIREPGRRLDTRALARESSPDFDRFWEAYPSRGQHPNPKQPARLKFNAAVKHGVDPGLIIAAAESYRAYAVEQGIECTAKVAQALTWLNQERYADRLQPAATQFGGGYRPMPSVAGG
jgi:hypothetical protein